MSASESIRLQAEEHPLVYSDSWESLKDYCLHLVHLKAYEYATELAADKSVLDLGCNNGYGTNELARSCREVVGVDVSPSAIADAQQRFAAGYYPRSVALGDVNGDSVLDLAVANSYSNDVSVLLGNADGL